MAKLGLFIHLIVIDVDDQLAFILEKKDPDELKRLKERIERGELRIRIPFGIEDVSRAY